MRPHARVLFAQPHPGVNADDEFGQMLRKARRDHFVEPVVFFAIKKAETSCSLFPLPHQTSGIDGHFAIANALPIAERDEGLITIRCGRCFATGSKPPPNALNDIRASIAALAATPCDVLVAAHPDFTGLLTIIDAQGKGDRAELIDSASCKRYAATAKERLERRLADEARGP